MIRSATSWHTCHQQQVSQYGSTSNKWIAILVPAHLILGSIHVTKDKPELGVICQVTNPNNRVRGALGLGDWRELPFLVLSIYSSKDGCAPAIVFQGLSGCRVDRLEGYQDYTCKTHTLTHTLTRMPLSVTVTRTPTGLRLSALRRGLAVLMTLRYTTM
jgi:hypothetical protein